MWILHCDAALWDSGLLWGCSEAVPLDVRDGGDETWLRLGRKDSDTTCVVCVVSGVERWLGRLDARLARAHAGGGGGGVAVCIADAALCSVSGRLGGGVSRIHTNRA